MIATNKLKKKQTKKQTSEQTSNRKGQNKQNKQTNKQENKIILKQPCNPVQRDAFAASPILINM